MDKNQAEISDFDNIQCVGCVILAVKPITANRFYRSSAGRKPRNVSAKIRNQISQFRGSRDIARLHRILGASSGTKN